MCWKITEFAYEKVNQDKHQVQDLKMNSLIVVLLNSSNILIAFDNSKVITLYNDNKLDVWDLDNFKLIHTLEGHDDSVTIAAVTSDNTELVSGSLDKTIKVWELNTGKLKETHEFCHPVGQITRIIDSSKMVYE